MAESKVSSAARVVAAGKVKVAELIVRNPGVDGEAVVGVWGTGTRLPKGRSKKSTPHTGCSPAPSAAWPGRGSAPGECAAKGVVTKRVRARSKVRAQEKGKRGRGGGEPPS